MAVSDAVTIFAVDRPRTIKNIAKRLAERRADLVAFIADGGVTDWAHYQRVVGEIEGIDVAAAICAEVEKQEEN